MSISCRSRSRASACTSKERRGERRRERRCSSPRGLLVMLVSHSRRSTTLDDQSAEKDQMVIRLPLIWMTTVVPSENLIVIFPSITGGPLASMPIFQIRCSRAFSTKGGFGCPLIVTPLSPSYSMLKSVTGTKYAFQIFRSNCCEPTTFPSSKLMLLRLILL